MKRSDLITRLAESHPPISAKNAGSVVKEILGAISNTLSKGGRVEIRGFGIFELNFRPPCQRRNPKTGDKVKVSAKCVPHFKVGKELKQRVIKGRCNRISASSQEFTEPVIPANQIQNHELSQQLRKT